MQRQAGRKALFCYVCHSCIHDGGLYQVYCRIVLCKRPMVNSGRPWVATTTTTVLRRLHFIPFLLQILPISLHFLRYNTFI